MKRIEFYLFEAPHTFMLGYSNNEEGFEFMLGFFVIVFTKG